MTDPWQRRGKPPAFCEILLHNLIGQNIILTIQISVWSVQKLIPTENLILGDFFHLSAGPDPGYYLNEKNDFDSDEEAQCVDFDNLTDDEASSKRLTSCPFID